MTSNSGDFQKAFVTGGTGLLGNNLVRELLADGKEVKLLARSREKAEKQFAGLDVEIVIGNMEAIDAFESELADCDALFHTAAHFRESYKGGEHLKQLLDINVNSTVKLFEAAYRQGLRRLVHTSSVAVLDGERGQLIDETMLRNEAKADPYYLSKILSERAVLQFAANHQDCHIPIILPGWMWGPGDIGPTSAGQEALDFEAGKLPGIPPSSFSIVDARDVARAMITAAQKGRSGERYLAAGRHISMAELMPLLEASTGVKAPTRQLPIQLLYLLAALYEVYGKLTGNPILLSLASVKLIANEKDKSHYNHAKSERELGIKFRPKQETVADTINWYREQGWLKNSKPQSRTRVISRS